jgi:hypothetical protein
MEMSNMKINCRLTIWLLALPLFLAQTGYSDTNKEEEASVQVTAPKRAAAYEINWQVISSGATDGTSASYRFQGTLGQPVIGEGSSTSYRLSHGFWQTFEGGCCLGIRGNVNGDPGDAINVADVTYLVAYLKGLGPVPPCIEEGDVNGSGTVNVTDVTYLVAYLKGIGPAPPTCF